MLCEWGVTIRALHDLPFRPASRGRLFGIDRRRLGWKWFVDTQLPVAKRVWNNRTCLRDVDLAEQRLVMPWRGLLADCHGEHKLFCVGSHNLWFCRTMRGQSHQSNRRFPFERTIDRDVNRAFNRRSLVGF